MTGFVDLRNRHETTTKPFTKPSRNRPISKIGRSQFSKILWGVGVFQSIQNKCRKIQPMAAKILALFFPDVDEIGGPHFSSIFSATFFANFFNEFFSDFFPQICFANFFRIFSANLYREFFRAFFRIFFRGFFSRIFSRIFSRFF